MAGVSAKVAERLVAGIKKFQPIIADAKTKDMPESDTVTIIADMLGEVFGYDKYSEVTSEYAVKGDRCDLAIKVENKLQAFIEVKAADTRELKESHTTQAVNYAANEGIDWVVLTNAVTWRIYRVLFEKPVSEELVVEFNFLELKPRSDSDIQKLYLLCKEAWDKSVLDEYETQRQALGRFLLGAVVLSEPILKTIRRELKRICPDVRIDIEEIGKALEDEVLKREILDDPKAADARKKVAKAASKVLRHQSADGDEGEQ